MSMYVSGNRGLSHPQTGNPTAKAIIVAHCARTSQRCNAVRAGSARMIAIAESTHAGPSIGSAYRSRRAGMNSRMSIGASKKHRQNHACRIAAG
jgi:hypothetical protein